MEPVEAVMKPGAPIVTFPPLAVAEYPKPAALMAVAVLVATCAGNLGCFGFEAGFSGLSRQASPEDDDGVRIVGGGVV